MTTKSKFESLSVHRFPARTRSGNVPESIPSPRTRSGCVSESIPSSSRTDGIPPTTPFSSDIIAPIGTLKSVVLDDWWLTKAKGKGLGVAGFESKGGGGIRQFSSGAISKRLDSNTLETCDGITVSIYDVINRSRSLQNGFSVEVCNRFLLGFPYDWNEWSVVEKKDEALDSDISFDDIPRSYLNSLLLSSSPLASKIMDEVVDSLRSFAYRTTQESNKECEKSEMGDNDEDDDDESLVPRVVGAKTRAMLKREEADEPSTAKRVHKTSKKKRS